MTKPLASLSLDLDNKWSYLKVRGDESWQNLPSYFDTVVPRILDSWQHLQLKATVFVVGQDAALEKNHDALRAIVDDGHEIANHSFHHEPWLHLYTPQQVAEELEMAEDAIEHICDVRPLGFRGPGFSRSDDVLTELSRRGYQYDATTFPTYLGPLARLYYFFQTRLSRQQREDRKELFGQFRDGFQTLHPHIWELNSHRLVELPVTTMPLVKTPIHGSYLLYLREFSPGLALAYFRMALRLCEWTGVEPSLLLHPLDFLGSDDEQDLAFFPGMKSPGMAKVAFMNRVLEIYSQRFRVVTMKQHAEATAHRLLPDSPIGEPQRTEELPTEPAALATTASREFV